MLPTIIMHFTVALVVLRTAIGVKGLGTTLPNFDNVTVLEIGSSVSPFNETGNGTGDICDTTKIRIIGGSKASQGDFPYQVSIQHSGWQLRHLCGGSVIDEQHVLTAAHCVDGKGPGDIRVIAGDVMLDRSRCTSVRRSVSAIFMHENYDYNTLENDIALLRVTEQFPLDSEFIMAIRLANAAVQEGTACNVTGWGIADSGSPDLPQNLQFVEVPIISAENCSDDKNEYDVRDGMICAGCREGGKDSCQGDSGGPLQCDGSLVGIVSWGVGCAMPGNPGVYTEVASYVDWINETKYKVSSVAAFHGQCLALSLLVSLMTMTVPRH